MTILLVDSRQTKNERSSEQLMAEVMNMLSDITISILNNIDSVTNMA